MIRIYCDNMEKLPDSLKIENNELLICLESVKLNLNDFWEKILLKHFTRHGLDHSQRIIGILGKLLKENDNLLNDQERFILVAAVYLHDIGMQNPIQAGLENKLEYDLNDAIIVREKHNETSAKIIREEPDKLGLNGKCRNYIDYIATIAEYHRKLDISDLETASIAGENIRLDLLAALLKLGDGLDLDFNRVNIDYLDMQEIPVESKFFWFAHYFVESVQIEKGKIILHFRFPENYRENKQIIEVFKNKIYESIKKEFMEVYDVFFAYGVHLYRDILIGEISYKSSNTLNLVPNDLEVYINENILKTVEITKNLKDQSNVVWELQGLLYSDDIKISKCITKIFNLFIKNEYKEAIKHLKKCEILTMAPKERLEFSIIAGNCNYFAGKYDEAKILYETALELTKNKKLLEIYENTVSIKAAVLGNLGVIHRDKGNFEISKKYLTDAIDISRTIGDELNEAIYLGNMGILYSDHGYLEKAIDYHKKSITLDKQLKYKEGIANNLGNIGLVYKDKGDLNKSLKYFNESLTIGRELKNLKIEAISLSNIGSIYKIKGELDKALKYFNESLSLNKRIGYKLGEGINLGSIGLIYKDKWDLSSALNYLNEELEINKKVGYKIGEASVLGNIGLIYKEKGDYKNAFKYLEMALDLNKEIKSIKGEASNLGDIGEIFSFLGQYDTAIDYFEEALEINKKIGYKLQYATNLIGIAKIYIDKSDIDKSISLLEESLNIIQKIGDKFTEALNLEYLGVAYSKKGNIDVSLDFLNKAYEINKEIGYSIGEATVLGNIGVLCGRKNPNQSIKYLKDSLKISEQVGAIISKFRL